MIQFALKLLFLCVILTSFPAGAADDHVRGKITGGILHQPPDWFKESFLEIADDVDEANEAGKHLMIFFELNGCPYCDRMLTESFEANPLSSYIQRHFDVIAINIQGDREVAFNEDISVTEKQLADILQVTATPALLFLDSDNKRILRVNGYRATERFKPILEFVATQSYQTTNLSDYLQAKLDKSVYQLRASPLFSEVRDLSAVDGPLLLIFEDGSCFDCNEFHDGVLANAGVRNQLDAYTVVRLDADASTRIVDVDGTPTTATELARRHEVIYRPGVLVFDDGNLQRRHDSLIYPHHFKESLRYVSSGFYRKLSYQDYSLQRTEELLASGVDIYLGRPK